MVEQYDSVFKQALSQGAVWATWRPRAFYRYRLHSLEMALVDEAGNLGEWQQCQAIPAAAVRIDDK